MARRPAVPRLLDRSAAIAWRLLVLAAALVVLIWVLRRLWVVVLAVVLATFAATVLGPVAVWLKQKGVPPLAAAWGVFLAGLAVVVGVGYLVVPAFIAELDEIGEVIGEATSLFERWLEEGIFGLSGQEVQQFVDQGFAGLRDNAGQLVAGVVAGTLMVAEVAAAVVLAFVITFFLLKDSERMTGAVLRLFPPDRREEMQEVGRRAWFAVGGYVRGSAVVGALDATAISVGLLIIGVPLVLPIALVTFVGAFFPFVGAVFAGLLAITVALVTQGLVPALLVSGVAFAVQQTHSNLLEPVVVGRAVRLHPVIILIALTAGSILFGILGALLAVPVTAAVFSVAGFYREKWEKWEGDEEAEPDE